MLLGKNSDLRLHGHGVALQEDTHALFVPVALPLGEEVVKVPGKRLSDLLQTFPNEEPGLSLVFEGVEPKALQVKMGRVKARSLSSGVIRVSGASA